MGLPIGDDVIGFSGLVVDGPNAGGIVRVVGGLRRSDGLMVVVGDDPETDVGALDALADVVSFVGGAIEWPSAAERASTVATAVSAWFAGRQAMLEEPFVGASFNASASGLVGCEVDGDAVLIELEATWDVRLRDVVALDVRADSLSVLARTAELTERHPMTAPSVSRLRAIPFRWVRP